MIIRELTTEEILKAVTLQKECWENDFKDIIPSGLYNVENEYQNILNWINDKNIDDIRKMFGAFINNELIGFAGSSFAEIEDSNKGVEINYLFVNEKHRNKAIGLKLINNVITEYRHYGVDELIVYSLNESQSNKFYRSLNPIVLKQMKQNYGNKINLVDVFKWNIVDIVKSVNGILKNRPYEKGGLSLEFLLDNNIIITTKSKDDDYETVCKGLIDYNVVNTNGLLRKPRLDIELYIKDNDKVVGAIFCDTYNYCLYIDVMWINDNYRKKGFGKQLINKAEDIARENGCLFSHTTTFSYQSPWFYQTCGYEIFAQLDDYPNNIVQYFLKKKL